LDSAIDTACTLLGTMRRTAMRRGAVTKAQRQLRTRIAQALENRAVPPALARRVSLQLVFKCDNATLGDRAVCSAIGQLLHEELVSLRITHGLSLRQAIGVLPKLSADGVETFLHELRGHDQTIARTIFNAALDAADPLEMGRRYLLAYRDVAAQVDAIDPSMARTLANATFTARRPRTKATEHVARFAALIRRFIDEPAVVRRVARAAFRTTDPVTVSDAVMREYRTRRPFP
jgi:hypothetical protein